MTKIITTIVLTIVAMPAVGVSYGLFFGLKAEKFVYPSILILWGVIIYFVWFT